MIWFLAVNVREPIARSNFSSESGIGGGGGREGIPRNSCWWCVALFSKDKREWANSLLPNTDPVSDQNLPFPTSVFTRGFWKLYAVCETITLFKLSQCFWKFLHIYKEEVFSSNFVNINTLYFVFQCWKRDLITHYERDTWKATTGQRLLPTCLTGRHVMWHGLSLKIAWNVTRMLLKIWSSLDCEFTAVKINVISKLK